MTPVERTHALRDLREIDIENLACGRITNFALMQALNRVQQEGFSVAELKGSKRTITSDEHRILADELNDMLKAASLVGAL